MTDDWTKRTEAVVLKATRLQALRDAAEFDVKAKTTEIEALSIRVETLAKVGELLRTLLDKLVTNRVRSLEDLVTEGLRSIFFDQELVFEAEIGQSRNKVSVDFFIREGKEGAVRSHPRDFGGGPQTIVSLILRTILLLRLKRFPLILLDESLVAPSDEYVPTIGRFLKKLSKTTGISILFVTQNRHFTEHSDHALLGTREDAADGSWSLGIRRIQR